MHQLPLFLKRERREKREREEVEERRKSKKALFTQKTFSLFFLVAIFFSPAMSAARKLSFTAIAVTGEVRQEKMHEQQRERERERERERGVTDDDDGVDVVDEPDEKRKNRRRRSKH